MEQPHNNCKSWSWTEKQHRRHSYGRYRHMNLKPQGCGKLWNTQQRQINKRELERLVNGKVEEANFWDHHRHQGLWDLW